MLRVIDSLQLTAKHKVATPVNWKQGDDVIIAGSVSDEDAKKSTRMAGRRRGRICGSCRNRRAKAAACFVASIPACGREYALGRDAVGSEADRVANQLMKHRLFLNRSG